MENTRIQQALEAATETNAFITGEGCRRDTPRIFQQHFPGATAIIIADDNTFHAAGKTVLECLQHSDIHVLEPFIFPGTPTLHAEYKHVEALKGLLETQPDVIPIAVGSGTVNDLVKRSVSELDRRYMVVATAASVDGYSSSGAPIVQNGFKKTMPCPAPLAIVADIEVLREAPFKMTAAGYADLMSKVPAGADWIVADFVGEDPIQSPIWTMIQPPLKTWLGAPEQLQKGDAQALEFLFEGLTMTGFAMQAMNSSRPASGADHLLSHILDMQHHRDAEGQSVSHGFQVSIGTLGSTALMEVVFARDIRQLDIDALCQRWKSWEEREREIRQAFEGTPIIDRVVVECRAKYIPADQLRKRLEQISGGWDMLNRKVKEQLFPYQQLKTMLQAADCPVAPEQINLPKEHLRELYTLAQMIRNRYTILDLAYELGWLEECVEEIIASDMYL